jgi:archaellum component FlaC
MNTNESQQRLEAIKNLIFGENMDQINTDFDSIKKLIEKRKLELESFIEETSKDLNTLIDNLSTDVNIRITDLEENLNEKIEALNHNKVDRSTLGTLLVSLGEKIMKD